MLPTVITATTGAKSTTLTTIGVESASTKAAFSAASTSNTTASISATNSNITCKSTCGYTINILKVHLLEVIIYILMKMHGKHSIKLVILVLMLKLPILLLLLLVVVVVAVVVVCTGASNTTYYHEYCYCFYYYYYLRSVLLLALPLLLSATSLVLLRLQIAGNKAQSDLPGSWDADKVTVCLWLINFLSAIIHVSLWRLASCRYHALRMWRCDCKLLQMCGQSSVLRSERACIYRTWQGICTPKQPLSAVQSVTLRVWAGSPIGVFVTIIRNVEQLNLRQLTNNWKCGIWLCVKSTKNEKFP